jgi:hypothetical protein
LVGVRLTKREEPELVGAPAAAGEVPANSGAEEANQPSGFIGR